MGDVVPMLSYEDGKTAIDWLTRVFGFRELTRIEASDGRISHAELAAGDGSIMLATPTRSYVSPRHHPEACPATRAWREVPYVIDGVLVYVDDLDGHFEKAKEAGASILSEPEGTEHGRHYRVEDLEGHRWMFTQR